jgi:hypothetical protein
MANKTAVVVGVGVVGVLALLFLASKAAPAPVVVKKVVAPPPTALQQATGDVAIVSAGAGALSDLVSNISDATDDSDDDTSLSGVISGIV